MLSCSEGRRVVQSGSKRAIQVHCRVSNGIHAHLLLELQYDLVFARLGQLYLTLQPRYVLLQLKSSLRKVLDLLFLLLNHSIQVTDLLLKLQLLLLPGLRRLAELLKRSVQCLYLLVHRLYLLLLLFDELAGRLMRLVLALQGRRLHGARLRLPQLASQVVHDREKLAALAALRHDFKLDFLAELLGLFNCLVVQCFESFLALHKRIEA